MNLTRHKVIRYMLASVFNTVLGMGLLAIGFDIFGLSAFVANLCAVLLGTGPMYMVNRRWVWRITGRSQFYAEIVPFWVLTLAGWLLSSGAVVLASRLGSSLNMGRGAQTALVVSGAMVAYILLWVVRFLVLDRTVFAPRSEA